MVFNTTVPPADVWNVIDGPVRDVMVLGPAADTTIGAIESLARIVEPLSGVFSAVW